MDTWQGSFGWESHALTGRPDLLNYIRTRDLTWEQLWAFYDEKGLPPAQALSRCLGLFHQYASWQLDLGGGMPESDGEVLRQLLEWARFTVRSGEGLPESAVRDQLLTLLENGSISPAYFEAAYQCVVRALVENYSQRWTGEGVADGDLESALDSSTPTALPLVVPDDPDGLPFAGDERWNRFKRALAAREQQLWSECYFNTLGELDDMLDTRPGL